jgi:hypothetical protein
MRWSAFLPDRAKAAGSANVFNRSSGTEVPRVATIDATNDQWAQGERQYLCHRPVRVGVVAIGWWSGVSAPSIEGSANIEMVTCFPRDRNKRREFAQCFQRRDAMQATAGLDDLVATTPAAPMSSS